MKIFRMFAILFLIVGSIALCGCTGSNTETAVVPTDEGVSTVETSTASSSSGDTEVQPAGAKAKETDALIKPILQSAFGSAILTESGTLTNSQGYSATYLKYKVDGSITDSKASQITSALESKGWTTTMSMVSSSGSVLMFVKNDKEYLSVAENADEKGYVYVQAWEGK